LFEILNSIFDHHLLIKKSFKKMNTNMKEVVTARIEQKLQNGYKNATEATTRLMNEGKIRRDFIFEVGTEKKGKETHINFFPDPTGRIGANFKLPQGNEDFYVHKHAVRQVADKLGVPGAYLTSLLFSNVDAMKDLGYRIMNTTNGWTDRNKVLVRAVGSEVRGFLSDQFRRLDSEMIFGTHIDEVFSNGAQLADGFMDDTRITIDSLLPQPIEIKTELNGSIFLAFGTRLATSDYGDGALELRSYILQGICLNGAVRESVLRAVHLGAKLPDNIGLSQKTYELDSQTTASAIRDLTKNLYSSDIIKTRMLEVKASSDMVVDPVRELKNLNITQKLLKGESDEIGKILMQNRPEDGLQGESTLWKLTQGITAYANNPDVSERRRMELQEIAGGLFNRVKN
jgi:hypothetical protein